MSLELSKARSIPVSGLVYNRFNEEKKQIAEHSRNVFKKHMTELGYSSAIIDLHSLETEIPAGTFSELF